MKAAESGDGETKADGEKDAKPNAKEPNRDDAGTEATDADTKVDGVEQDVLAALDKPVAAFEKVVADAKPCAKTLEEMRSELRAFRDALPADVQRKKAAADEPLTKVQSRRKVHKAVVLDEDDTRVLDEDGTKQQPPAKKARTAAADGKKFMASNAARTIM